MSKIEIRETKLPGVGIQHDFELESGRRIGIITHHSGRRDFLMFDSDDPDMCSIALKMSEEEASLLGEMLGANKVVNALANIHQFVGGLSIDWIPVGADWLCSGTPIRDIGLRQIGANIIAVVRNGKTIPSPDADFQIMGGDTVVVVGRPESIKETHDMMQGDPT